MSVKKIIFVAISVALMLTGCGTMPSTDGSPTSGMPGSMPGGIPGGMPSGMPGSVPGSSSSSLPSGGVMSGGSSGESGSSDKSGDVATTADERRGTLDKSLDDSLGEFDKTLEGEQRRTAEERDARAANRSTTTSTSGSDGGVGRREGDLRSERSGQAGSGGGDTSSGDRRDRGTVAGGGSGAPDRGIPSGEDDDIVARRLRRAAEQETDPELKEKLWKEYTEYKRNVQGKG